VTEDDVVAMLGKPPDAKKPPPPGPVKGPVAPESKASDSGPSVTEDDVVALLGEPAVAKKPPPPEPVKEPAVLEEFRAEAEPQNQALPEETSALKPARAAADEAVKHALRDGTEGMPLTKKPAPAGEPKETAAAGSARAAVATQGPVETEATREVEDALRWLLNDKHAQLMSARAEKKLDQQEGSKEQGPTTTWAGRLLEIVDRELKKAGNEGKLLIVDMFKRALDPAQMVPDDRRRELAGFCHEIVDKTGRLAFGREAKRREYRRVARSFAQQLLNHFGRDSEAVDVALGYGSRPTLAQIIAKMDPERTPSLAAQQRALDLLAEELGRQTRSVRQQRDPVKRATQVGECNKAIEMARQTKAYRDGMDSEQRKAYEGNLSSLEQRLNRNPETGLPERMKKT
jgi:hypothetical protein